MNIPYLDRITVNKITGKAVGLQREQTDSIIKAIRQEIPELIAVAVIDIKSGRTLSALTTTKAFDPYKATTPNVQFVKKTYENLTLPWLAGQALENITIVLDNQLHCLRPFNGGLWYCYLVVSSRDTNLAMAKDILRKCAR